MAYGRVLKIKLDGEWREVEAIMATEGDGTVVQATPCVGPGGGVLLIAASRPAEGVNDRVMDAVPGEDGAVPAVEEAPAAPATRGRRRQGAAAS